MILANKSGLEPGLVCFTICIHLIPELTASLASAMALASRTSGYQRRYLRNLFFPEDLNLLEYRLLCMDMVVIHGNATTVKYSLSRTCKARSG